MEIEAPAMPEAGHRAILEWPVVERGAGMRADVFHGIELPFMLENGHVAFANFKLASFTFWDVIDTGKTDGVCV
jgi:hypothetical protein